VSVGGLLGAGAGDVTVGGGRYDLR
jgi:hypothetical protein